MSDFSCNTKSYAIENLLYLMQRLRDPSSGCPWDIKQSFESITPSTIEEAYELVDAIEQGQMPQIKEELGDVLFQVVFYAQMAEEQGDFNFHDIVDGLTAKLIRRHPHVFPTGNLHEQVKVDLDEAEVKKQWEAIKQQERAGKALTGRFDDIPQALPALSRAQKIVKRQREGQALSIDEEITALQKTLKQLEGKDVLDAEKVIGEILFDTVKLAKCLKIDAEKALRKANDDVINQFNRSV